MERIEIPVGDMVFDALVAGPEDGALVLLLHGFPETSWSWRHQLPALAEAGYRAVAPDQRGYSPRARPDGLEQYRIQHLTADVDAPSARAPARDIDPAVDAICLRALQKEPGDRYQTIAEMEELLRNEPDYPYRKQVLEDLDNERKIRTIICRAIPD